MPATLLILAGGEGLRMGRPKELLPWRGSTLIETVYAEVGPGFDEVLIATPAAERLPEFLRRYAIPDGPGAGPLAGLEAGLTRARNEAVVALACDMPNVNSALLGVLVDRLGRHEAAVPFVGAGPDPLCAAYSRRALPAVRVLLESASESRRRPPTAALLDLLDVRYMGRLEFSLLGLGDDLLLNLNTPQDYQVLITGE